MNNTDLGRDHRSEENPRGRDTMYTHRNRKWLGLTAMLAVLALAAGACSSDEEAADDRLLKIAVRSEERRAGKEWRTRLSPAP